MKQYKDVVQKIFFILTLSLSGCQAPNITISKQQKDNDIEIENLKDCQQDLSFLRRSNNTKYNEFRRKFDTLLLNAQQYGQMRGKLADDTQDTLDSLYRYRLSQLCIEIQKNARPGSLPLREEILP